MVARSMKKKIRNSINGVGRMNAQMHAEHSQEITASNFPEEALTTMVSYHEESLANGSQQKRFSVRSFQAEDILYQVLVPFYDLEYGINSRMIRLI